MTDTKKCRTNPIYRQLLSLATPLIIGNILQQLYNTADAFMLGRYSGTLEFACVGIAGSIMNLFLFMISGACNGISVIFAQLYGADDTNTFRREHLLALVLGMIVTILTAFAGFLLLPPLLRIIKTPADLTPYVTAYLHIILLSLPAAFLSNLYSALLRAINRADIALFALFTAVGTNLVLDYYFLAKCRLGITGAAWATALSQCVAAFLCMLYLRCRFPVLLFTRADCRLDPALLFKTAYFGFVTSLHQSSLYIGKLLVQGAVNTGGEDMISAYTATTRIEGFANSFGDSGCTATSVLTAQTLGAAKKEQIQRIFTCSLILMLLLGLALSFLMYQSAGISVAFMLGQNTGTAFSNATSYMKCIALFYTFCFIGNTFAGYFDGLGHVLIPFIGSACHIALRVVLSFLLLRKMGLSAVALATGLGWVFVNLAWGMVKHQQ